MKPSQISMRNGEHKYLVHVFHAFSYTYFDRTANNFIYLISINTIWTRFKTSTQFTASERAWMIVDYENYNSAYMRWIARNSDYLKSFVLRTYCSHLISHFISYMLYQQDSCIKFKFNIFRQNSDNIRHYTSRSYGPKYNKYNRWKR